MTVAPSGFDLNRLFPSLRNPLALVSTSGDDVRLVAATPRFHAILGIDPQQAGQPILGLLPEHWRPSVDAAIKACMGARRSKRVRSLAPTTSSRPQYELEVYRPLDAGLSGHLLLALEHLDHVKWFADPRVVSLFPQLQTNTCAFVYENDLRADRTRYRDNGLVHLLGLPRTSHTFSELIARTHPQDRPEIDRYLADRARMTDDDINTMTFRAKAITGDWRLVTIRARVLRRDAAGAPIRMLGVAADTTDHNAVATALDDAQHALIVAEVEERRRIGRELHDSTAQHLLAISFGLMNLKRSISPTTAVAEVLDDLTASIEAAGREIRMFSFLLHPPEITEKGLIPALRRLCSDFGRRTGMAVELEVDGGALPVAEEVESAMYRVAQEALMNAFRHAHAKTVVVRVRWRLSDLAVEIEDDGPGLPPLLADERAPHEGVGLQAMRGRMLEIGGSLTLGQAHPGLTVLAQAPLASLRQM